MMDFLTSFPISQLVHSTTLMPIVSTLFFNKADYPAVLVGFILQDKRT